MTSLSDRDREILEGKNFAHLVTLMRDGSPQVTPVWIDVEDGMILVNSAEGRVKTNNVKRDPRVAISIYDEADPYGGVVSVRGLVKEVTTAGADAHIDKMAKKYIGQDKYPWKQPGEQRVLLKIEPERVVHAS
jgi:PPOX class probable F420-dependent enzyme